MKTPAELAARLRKMVLAAQHHYSPQGEPMRSIVVSPEWLEDLADAALRLELIDVCDKLPTMVDAWKDYKGPEVSGKVVSVNKV